MTEQRKTPSEGSQQGAAAVVFVGLALFSVVFYARAIGFDFVGFDDHQVLLGHPELFNENSFAASLRTIFVDYFPREEPLLLRDVSWALDARLFGLANPLGFHLGNVILNALNVGLLFLLMRLWTGDLRVATAVAGLFAVLPVHVEAVCWVMGRKDMLSAAFMLGGLLVQTAELQAPNSRRRWSYRALVLLFTTCALFSKASSVAFVIVLALHRFFHAYLPLGRDREQRAGRRGAAREPLPTLLLAVLPHLLITAAFLVWYTGVLSAYGVIETNGPSPTTAVHLEKVATFLPLILGRYVLSLTGLTQLSMLYRWPHVAIPLTSAELLASALVAVLGVAGIVVLLRRRPDLAFYVLAALGLLAPYAGLQYVGFWAADRYIYLASGFGLAAAVIPLAGLAGRNPSARIAVLTLGFGFFLASAAQGWLQQSVWQDNEALWSYEAYRDEPSLLSIQALAKQYLRNAEAAQDPVERNAWVRLAEAEIVRGFARHADLDLQPTAYKLKETLHLSRLHSLRGRVLELRGAPKEDQVAHFRRAFAIAPDRTNAMLISGALFEIAGRERNEAKRQQFIEGSFDAFVAYVEMGRWDSSRHAQSRELLARNFEGRFPFLDQRIAEVKRIYFP